MVVGLGLGPSLLIVAGLAVLAQAPLMSVISLVATDARRRGLAIGFATLMTAIAGHRCVPPLKTEICLLVVECPSIKAGDVSVRTLVITMAMATLTRCRCRILAVEPNALLSIGRDLIVTIEAQRRLGIPTKWRVALVAVVFVLLVSLHERSGSNELFEQGLRL